MSTRNKEGRVTKADLKLLYATHGTIKQTKGEYQATINIIVEGAQTRRRLMDELLQARTKRVVHEIQDDLLDLEYDMRDQLLDLEPYNRLPI